MNDWILQVYREMLSGDLDSVCEAATNHLANDDPWYNDYLDWILKYWLY